MEPFDLLETILFVPNEGFFLLPLHLARLERSAHTLGFPAPNENQIEDQLKSQVPNDDGPQRVRLLYNQQGNTTIEYTRLPTINTLDRLTQTINDQTPLKVALDTQPTETGVFVQHKTTQRSMYNAARERVTGVFDVVLWNKDHQVTETSIANLAIGTRTSEGRYTWKTPSLDCGLLSGVFRQHLLDLGNMVESKITTDDLILAQKNDDLIVCFNSVRKIYRVCLVL
ncbi:aminotransferase [Chlamydoabsidia padenii]|nr:aminotransferase [Chlamydoabsidia padenii]